MLHYYRLDLREEYVSAGCRRLCALVAGLPPDSATVRDGKVWTTEREIAAVLVEQLDRWGAAFMTLLAGKKTQAPSSVTFQHPDRPGKPDASIKTTRPVRRLTVGQFAEEWAREESKP